MLTIRNLAAALALGLAGGPACGADLDAAPPATTVAQTAINAITVRGFRVELLPDEAGSLPQAPLQQAADAAFTSLANGQLSAQLNFAQLQRVADAVSLAARQAGFPVATAYIPPQALDASTQRVTLRVLQGKVGKITVQGESRYSPGRIAAAARGMTGQMLRQQDLESAVLYARDLPGVSVIPLLQPGEHPGETDVVLVTRQIQRPLQVELGVNNHGTDNTGRGRAQLGVHWDSPLGLGDMLVASYVYAFDPHQSSMSALSYAVPLTATGLSATAGYSRSQLEIRNGPFAALGLNGPTTQQYIGADWKPILRDSLLLQFSARYIDEKSRLRALGFDLSNQKFKAAELGFTLRHTHLPGRRIDLVQASVRQALDDDSAQMDLISPGHDRHFTVVRGGYTHLQGFGTTQRVLLRFNGQYSDDVLVPMEQFSLGGPDTVRAFEQSAVLGDTGYAATLEYQVDAPGLADAPSPFSGLRWADVLGFNVFFDQGRVYSNSGAIVPAALQGAGVGLNFRQPNFHALQMQLTAAVPTSRTQPADGHDVRVWASVSMTF